MRTTTNSFSTQSSDPIKSQTHISLADISRCYWHLVLCFSLLLQSIWNNLLQLHSTVCPHHIKCSKKKLSMPPFPWERTSFLTTVLVAVSTRCRYCYRTWDTNLLITRLPSQVSSLWSVNILDSRTEIHLSPFLENFIPGIHKHRKCCFDSPKPYFGHFWIVQY